MEHLESMARYASMGVETVFPFNIAEKTVVKIQPRTDSVGILEVHVAEAPAAAACYLWRGFKTAAECEEDLAGPICTFDVAGALQAPGTIKVEPGLSQLTLFAKKLIIGYLRICEYPGC